MLDIFRGERLLLEPPSQLAGRRSEKDSIPKRKGKKVLKAPIFRCFCSEFLGRGRLSSKDSSHQSQSKLASIWHRKHTYRFSIIFLFSRCCSPPWKNTKSLMGVWWSFVFPQKRFTSFQAPRKNSMFARWLFPIPKLVAFRAEIRPKARNVGKFKDAQQMQ